MLVAVQTRETGWSCSSGFSGLSG